MGIEVALVAMATVAVAAKEGQMYQEYQGYKSKEHALDTEGKQLKIQSQQKTLANYAAMEKVIDAQTAHMTTTGAAFSSPSFNAIERNTLNIGAKKGANIELEDELAQENIKMEKKNVRNTLYAQLFGDTASIATSVAGVYNASPSKV